MADWQASQTMRQEVRRALAEAQERPTGRQVEARSASRRQGERRALREAMAVSIASPSVTDPERGLPLTHIRRDGSAVLQVVGDG